MTELKGKTRTAHASRGDWRTYYRILGRWWEKNSVCNEIIFRVAREVRSARLMGIYTLRLHNDARHQLPAPL